MKYNRVISIAAMFLLLGSTLPAFAQKGDEERGGGQQKAQPAQHQAPAPRAQPAKAQPQRAQAQPQQRTERAQPQRAPAAQPQRTQATQRQAQPQRSQQAQQRGGQQQQSVAYNGGNNGNHGNGNNGNHFGRISNANYSSHFGHEHSFHMGRPQMIGGYNRFQYGGYWFGYNEGWPVGWGYDDDCYVEYIDGAYYMFNVRHPGFRLTLNIF